MNQFAVVSVALAILVGNLALAADTPPCEMQVATVSDLLHRDTSGVVTAPVAGVASFLTVPGQITVSGVVNTNDSPSQISFNGGPFPLISVSSTQLVWQQTPNPDPLNDAIGGNGFIFPVVGSPNLIVQFQGNSAQFSVAPVSDTNNAYSFSYGSMSEITPDGSVVKGRKVNISGQQFVWSAPYTNGAYTQVALCGSFPVGTSPANLRADHFICPANAQCAGPALDTDSLKFGLNLGWPFVVGSNDRLQVQMRIKVPSQVDEVDVTPSSFGIAALTLTLKQGPTLKLTFPSGVTVTQALGQPPALTSDGYSVDAKTSDTGIDLYLTFPRSIDTVDWRWAVIQVAPPATQ